MSPTKLVGTTVEQVGTVSEVEYTDILCFSASPDAVQCPNSTKGGQSPVNANKGVVKLPPELEAMIEQIDLPLEKGHKDQLRILLNDYLGISLP